MNWQALFDGILAVVALGIAFGPARSSPAARLACMLLGSAAVLGTLRFSGLLPLPALHQFVSMLGAGVGLPLLAVAVSQPASAVTTQRRYAWIFAVLAAVLCTLVVMVAQFKAWAAVCAVLSALTILAFGLSRRQALTAVAGLMLLLAFGAFAAKLVFAGLQPGDLLHIGLTLGLLLLTRPTGRAATAL